MTVNEETSVRHCEPLIPGGRDSFCKKPHAVIARSACLLAGRERRGNLSR